MEYSSTPEEQQEYLAYSSTEIFFENLEHGLEELRNFSFVRKKKKVILIAGAMVVFDKGTIDFLNHIAEVEKDSQIILLSEVTAEFRRKTRDTIQFEFICTPHLLAKEILVPYMDLPTSEEILDYVADRMYLSLAAKNFQEQHREKIGKNYAQTLMYYADCYLRLLLKKTMPNCVILWNEFYAFHRVLDFLSRENHIKVRYMEFGCIPGTFTIESKGQQGESFPARYPFVFRGLSVSKEDVDKAQKVIAYIFQNRLNRNVQPVTDRISKKLLAIKDGKPVITFMGQNDFEAGIYPYTRKSQKYHSPIFRTSLEAMEYLRLLSLKNDWRFLYKPHPLMEAERRINDGMAASDMENTIYLNHADINDVIDGSDLVITILSQSAYIALLREKPVVMLGYTQLKNSGCTYEAFTKGKIEPVIKKALKRGFSGRQRKRFLRHVAQELKYYLWDDGKHPEMPFGRRYREGDIL